MEEGRWRMRSRSCCYGNGGEQVLGAGRQQVRKENGGRRHSAHSNASSLSPCWSHIIPNYHWKEGAWAEGMLGTENEKSILVSAWTFHRAAAHAFAKVNAHACHFMSPMGGLQKSHLQCKRRRCVHDRSRLPRVTTLWKSSSSSSVWSVYAVKTRFSGTCPCRV